MRDIILAKFTQNARCKQVLLSTKGQMLYEDSPYDDFWGIGSAKNGQNHLGKLLVEIRNRIIESV